MSDTERITYQVMDAWERKADAELEEIAQILRNRDNGLRVCKARGCRTWTSTKRCPEHDRWIERLAGWWLEWPWQLQVVSEIPILAAALYAMIWIFTLL